MGEEQFIITTDEKTKVVSKNHSKSYPFGIALKPGRHYRFSFRNSDVVDHYKCFLPGYAYIGELLQDIDQTKQPEKWYFHIKIPNNLEEAKRTISLINNKLCYWYDKTNSISNASEASFFTEEQIKSLVRPDFEFTEGMNSFQKWCWDNTNVYIFQDIYFRIMPKSKMISFLKITPSNDGKELIFEERLDESFNYIANYFPYGKRVVDQEDATNLPLGVDFGIEGRVENPWMADNLFSDVFTQNDMNVRGEAAKIINQFSFLNKPILFEKMLSLVQNLQGVTNTPHSQENITQIAGENKSTQHVLNEEEEGAEKRKNRLAFAFEPAILSSLNKLENYTGFDWRNNVQIFNIYPSGHDAEKILAAQTEGVVAQQKSVGDMMRTMAELGENLAKIHLLNIEEQNKNKRELEKELNYNLAQQDLILKKAQAEVETIKQLAEANAEAVRMKIEPFVKNFGKDGAKEILINEQTVDAISNGNSTLFANMTSSGFNNSNGFGTNSALEQMLAKKLELDLKSQNQNQKRTKQRNRKGK